MLPAGIFLVVSSLFMAYHAHADIPKAVSAAEAHTSCVQTRGFVQQPPEPNHHIFVAVLFTVQLHGYLPSIRIPFCGNNECI